MKRRFTRILAAVALLVGLTIPLGMWGQSSTSTITIDYNSVTDFPTGPNVTYGAYHWESDNVGGTINCANGNQNGTFVLQFNYSSSGTTNGRNAQHVANTVVVPGYITGITMTKASGTDRKWKAYVGTSALTSTNYSQAGTDLGEKTVSSNGVTWTADASNHYNYFYLNYTVGSACYISSIVITYEPSTGPVTPTCATPTFSPAAGTYTQAQNVSINCSTEGATIYYTTNGQDPTTSSTVYSGTINISTNTTIKAMAVKSGFDNSAVATAEYAFVTLEHAGTFEDPYTVADARNAIDANTGTQGVYATGIVSAIPTEWSTQYNNITFNFVDNVGDDNFLQAYRCVSGTGVDASTVAVGDIVVVHGNLTKYGSTYEFGQGCELVSLTHPVITTPTVTVTPSTINAPFAGAEGTLALTYENIENFSSFDYYFCDANGDELEGNDPDWIYAEIIEENDAHVLSYNIDANDGEARTAYLKVYTTIGDELNPEEVYAIVTVNQEEYVAPTYAELPFAFNSGKAAIDETDGLYQDGLGDDYNENTNPNTQLKFDGTGDWLLLQFQETPGTLTFDVKGNPGGNPSVWAGAFKMQTSVDGETYTDLRIYTDLTTTVKSESFDLNENVRYIKWIYTEKVSGNVGLGNIALAEYTEPQQYTLTVEPFENLELITFVNDEMVMEGDGEIQVTEGDQIMLSIVALEGYEMETLMVNGVNHVNDIAADYTYSFDMPAENVTISATAVEDVPPTPGDKYVKVTSSDDLTSGQYLIVYEEGNVAFDGSLETLDAASNTIEVTINDSEIGIDNLTIASEFTIDVTSGTIKSASGYYIGQTSDANGMQTSQETAYTNTISFDESGNANIVSSGGAYLRYNSASNQNRFRYYKSSSYSGQKAIQLYKKVETLPANSIKIIGYGDSAGGYYLIASPFTVNPEAVQGMTTGDFDLYQFNQSANSGEWENWKQQGDHYHFDLIPGTGYLYAHKTTVILSFDGTPYDGDGTKELVYDANANLAGWNLIGNPFTEVVYLVDEDNNYVPFYTMNEDGSDIVSVSDNTIEAMQGVMVHATAEGQSVTFTKTAPAPVSKLALNLSKGSAIVDCATVRFDEGLQLPKFQMNANNTKLYIPEGQDEFAVVNSINENSTPVNFRAAESGTYTLSVNAENVEMEYLHLIDNKTGNDIDLLATPSYTFEANTTDAVSRFNLVYATYDDINENNVQPFAFFNGSEWVVNNEGNAELQVIDITGRIVKSESVNGCTNVNVNAAPGVYMLRLVNGDNVKVQKVVVK